MTGSKFARPLREKGGGVAARPPKLGQTFRRDGAQENDGRIHAALCRETQLEAKPGPIAVSNVRGGSPAPIRRSSTKSPVGADMLPSSASTLRSGPEPRARATKRASPRR